MTVPTAVERAFELASGGSCRTVEDIRKRLSFESYLAVDAHLAGTAIRKQLNALMRAAATQATGTNAGRGA